MGLLDVLRGVPVLGQGLNLFESIVDTARDPVKPIRGSILYCDLAMGAMEHSGVYVGDYTIVQVDKDGYIRKVTPFEFSWPGTALAIYVSSNGTSPAGAEKVALRAEGMVGKRRRYNVLTDNCHRFCVGCLTGDFNNSSTLLYLLKSRAKECIGANDWRQWDIDEMNYYGIKD